MSSRNCQIFVTKLPRGTSSDEVRRAFKKFGEIRSIKMKGTYCFVVSSVPISRVAGRLTAGVRRLQGRAQGRR